MSFEEWQAMGNGKGSTVDNYIDTTSLYHLHIMRDKMKAPRETVEKIAAWLKLDPDAEYIDVKRPAQRATGFGINAGAHYSRNRIAVRFNAQMRPLNVYVFNAAGNKN